MLELPWETTVKHLNDFSHRMRASGYSEKYRFEIIKSGVEGFDKMIAEEIKGGRPKNNMESRSETEKEGTPKEELV